MDRIICRICEQAATGEQVNKALKGPVPTSLDVCPHCRQEVILDWSSKSQDYLERAKKYLAEADTCDWCGNKIGASSFIIFGAYKYHTPPYFCSWECRQAFLNNFKQKFPHMFELVFKGSLQESVNKFLKNNPEGVEIKVKIIKQKDEQEKDVRFYDGPRYCGNRNLRGVQVTIEDFGEMVKNMLHKKTDKKEEKD